MYRRNCSPINVLLIFIKSNKTCVFPKSFNWIFRQLFTLFEFCLILSRCVVIILSCLKMLLWWCRSLLSSYFVNVHTLRLNFQNHGKPQKQLLHMLDVVALAEFINTRSVTVKPLGAINVIILRIILLSNHSKYRFRYMIAVKPSVDIERSIHQTHTASIFSSAAHLGWITLCTDV